MRDSIPQPKLTHVPSHVGVNHNIQRHSHRVVLTHPYSTMLPVTRNEQKSATGAHKSTAVQQTDEGL